MESKSKHYNLNLSINRALKLTTICCN